MYTKLEILNWIFYGVPRSLPLCGAVSLAALTPVQAQTKGACPTMSPQLFGSSNMITAEQHKDVLSAYGIKP